ncbi:Retrovirus-related Pol polyprotein from transposon TNT 1-94 [Sesamum angolense]|uniref:Retrovirus-related Pol polyprotein from transposon TNT 1-94 n=1 Tax=Sesamum angolense TaxID=2727404 RepID=A0AAE1T406_9LAMI|nr:Retrovirus-related Pol polyprotein from transposon TNT 1-94 [Sesamum angolense]
MCYDSVDGLGLTPNDVIIVPSIRSNVVRKLISPIRGLTYVLDKSLPQILPEGFLPRERLTFEKFNQWHEDNRKVRSIVLSSMRNEIQKQYERYEDVWSIMHRMKELYAEELSLVQLGSHLHIEESLRAQENDKPKGKDVVGSSSMNMVEDHRATKTNDRKGKRKIHDNKHDGSSKKSKLTCWKCGKSGHFKRDCRVGKGGNHCKNTNGTSGSGEGDHNPNEDDDVAWWIDSDATTHACKDRGWFKVFQPVDASSVLHMENESSAPIVFESDKYILSKSGVFADFGYYNNEAINDEMDSIMGNNTWVLADLPPGCKLLGCKWIFKKKMKGDGTIKKFKARLVIQGFRQRPGIYYFDTYVPIAHRSTIRLLIGLASIHNLVIHQMDVKTTFLNGDLDEEVYMKQPEGFIMPGNEHKQVDLTKEFLSSRFSMKDIGRLMGSLLEYSKVIGCLMYAMTSTRSDIAYAMGKLSRFTSNPSTHHWEAIRRASKKQTCITNSTMEFEFVVLAAAGKEVEWLKNLIHEIPLWPKPISPISIHCDSAATLAKAYSQMYNVKSRHLGVRHSMIIELIMNDVISVKFVRSQHNLADHLTKGLARDLVHKSVIGMGLSPFKPLMMRYPISF